MSELDSRHRNLLRLIERSAGIDGWAPVSAKVYPLLSCLPPELATVEPVGTEGRGRASLTEIGRTVLKWV